MNHKSRRRARGVTLVEVLIVVAILSLIAGSVALFAVPRLIAARIQVAQNDARTLIQVVELHRMSRPEASGECPTFEALKASTALKADQNTSDPWRHPYRILCDGMAITVVSEGPDGVAGNDDDIWAGPPPKGLKSS